MDITRFSEADWAEVRERLKRREGNFTEKSYLAWLLAEGREAELEKKYGVGWTLAQALTEATGGPKEARRASKKKRREREGEAEEVEPEGSGDEFEKRVEILEAQYEEQFEDVMPHDRVLLRSMAATAVNLDELNRLIQREYTANTTSPDKVQKLSSALEAQNRTYKQLQEILGIDRVTRGEQAEKRSDVEEILEVMDEAAEMLEKQSVLLQHVCGENMGRVLTAFREFRWEIRVERCPLCGQRDVVWVHEPNAEDLRAKEPEMVGEIERMYWNQLKPEDEES